jgi:2-keto-myo-inositol isomerase
LAEQIHFALNQIVAPALPVREFIDLAANLGCQGVELRNDLVEKGVSSAAFFDGHTPAEIGEYAREKKVRLLGLSEVYGFNRWSEDIYDKVKRLIEEARQSGAESISLIPSNDGAEQADGERLGDIQAALSKVLPLLMDAGLIALVEPLGFKSSSLRYKREAVAAIDAVGGRDHFRLVHDTFHHHLSGETEFFPDMTGIVHISGVVDGELSPDQMKDGDRVLVDDRDWLGNVQQIRSLVSLGFRGAHSYEPFARSVHLDRNVQKSIGASMTYLQGELAS